MNNTHHLLPPAKNKQTNMKIQKILILSNRDTIQAYPLKNENC